MTESILITLAVAVVLETIGMALTWRLIWPKYKLVGKPVFYLAVTVLLAWYAGWWSMLWVVLHPLSGWLLHVRFCKTHGFTPWRVEDPERYVQLMKDEVAAFEHRLRERADQSRD